MKRRLPVLSILRNSGGNQSERRFLKVVPGGKGRPLVIWHTWAPEGWGRLVKVVPGGKGPRLVIWQVGAVGTKEKRCSGVPAAVIRWQRAGNFSFNRKTRRLRGVQRKPRSALSHGSPGRGGAGSALSRGSRAAGVRGRTKWRIARRGGSGSALSGGSTAAGGQGAH